ncbi:MAG TPA: serine hydrolase domain-containing protein [Gemmataceae bacterium]|jgi:CubicO group peptidase (beta-lactamase class C family)|nr:serine hydrolase domain-containing protein [Gemmataceae bacterium]
MRRPIATFLSAFLVGALVQFACAAEPKSDAEGAEKSRRVDELVRKYLRDDGPGMAVLVVQDGHVVHKKGYGLADLRKHVPITPETTFELASVSKQFTAMAIMILHDRGKLSFDDDVRKYLPVIPEYNPKRPIRLTDLLHHTSGLRDYMELKDIPSHDPDFPTNAEVMRELVKHKLKFPTGSKYEYSNSNYVLLAQVIAHVSHKSYGTFLHEAIFGPLGMKDTVAYEDRKVKRIHPAVGYELKPKLATFKENEPPAEVRAKTAPANFRVADSECIVVGDGSIWTNLNDMVQWDAALREGKSVKPETLKRAWTNLQLDNGKKPEEDYGFGWGLVFNRQGKLIEVTHDGAWIGFSTSIRRYLDDRLTIVVLCNVYGFDIGAIEVAIHNIYCGKR